MELTILVPCPIANDDARLTLTIGGHSLLFP